MLKVKETPMRICKEALIVLAAVQSAHRNALTAASLVHKCFNKELKITNMDISPNVAYD